MKVAVIGTVGVPANYGGFETLVENLLDYKNNVDFQYNIYCSSRNYKEKKQCYKGARLIYLPFSANGMQSIIYDLIAIFHAIFTADILLILGTSGCIIMPIVGLLSKKKVIVNIDGLEHRREKWEKLAKKFLKISEKLAVRHANVIIADNKAIQNYIETEYGKEANLIEYGGDNAFVVHNDQLLWDEFGLRPQEYSFKVARIERENNIEMILESFREMPLQKLVIVGNWEKNKFGMAMKNKYKKYSNIAMLNPIYDLFKLNLLRSNCKFYIHGHSAGGTNPSLVEAMSLGLPIIAYDIVFNRETTENKALFFKDSEELKKQLQSAINTDIGRLGEEMGKIARQRYTWRHIVNQYQKLLF